jgi:hypothetical protein
MPKKNHTPTLPIEIWNMILRYSISVPDFFDPDGMVGRFPIWVIRRLKWSDPGIYYKAESMRNTLRRVCRAWDTYLCPYAHRFVRMDDVIHGYVPLQYLKSAIRVSFGEHTYQYCDTCKLELFRSELPSRRPFRTDYSELCRYILEHKRPFRTQIIDYGELGHLILEDLVLSHVFPNLQCIQGFRNRMPANELIEDINSLPFLRQVFVELEWAEYKMTTLSSSTLTTLYISLPIINTSFTPFTDKTFDLPALKHLHIEESYEQSDNEYETPLWLHLVRILGRDLRTLYVPVEGKCTIKCIPGEIWTICPKLEDLYSPLQPPSTPPPVGHPLHTLGLVCDYIAEEDCFNDYEYVPDWPGLRTIRIDLSWEDWTKCGCGPLPTSQLEELGPDVSLQDDKGESLVDYISRVEFEINGSSSE